MDGGSSSGLAGGYRFAQVYAPSDDDVIAYEAMTAPTNALVSGADLSLLEPGHSYEASFSIESCRHGRLSGRAWSAPRRLPSRQAAEERSTAPDRQAVVLTALILVAAVANLNLAVANVALPDIGKAFDAGQTALNLVAVGYSLGLAASVLYLARSAIATGANCCCCSGSASRSRPACSLPSPRRSRSCSPLGSSAGYPRAWRSRRPWR